MTTFNRAPSNIAAGLCLNGALMTRSLLLDLVRVDGGTQVRFGLSPLTVSEYAEALPAGAKFPPIVVFFDGSEYWLADGFHRLEAHRQAGLQQIDADVHDGSRRDAMLYAAAANAEHGLRRTAEDKKRAVLILLRDPEWRQWSDREIAGRVKVDHKTVAKYRRKLNGEIPVQNERRFTTRHGTEARRTVAPNGASVEPGNENEDPATNTDEAQRGAEVICGAPDLPPVSSASSTPRDHREAAPKRHHAPVNEAVVPDRLSAEQRALAFDAMADQWGTPPIEELAAEDNDDDGPPPHDQSVNLADDRPEGPIEAQRTRNSGITVGGVANGEIEGSETAGAAIDDGNDAAALDGADGKQGRTDAMTEPDGMATEGEAKPPETPDPEKREDIGQEVAQVCRHGPKKVATPVELQIYPVADPYSNIAPLWVRGALQSIGPLTQELSTLECIPNCNRITELVLQLIDALAPVCLENPIPEEKRGKIVSLLRYCGYQNFADQLLHHWAEADAAIAQAQTEMLCQELSPSG